MAKDKLNEDLLERWKQEKGFNNKAKQKRQQRKK